MGYESAEELISRPPLSLIPPEFHETIQNRFKNITEQGGSHNPPIDQVFLKKNGERIFTQAESIAVIHLGVPSVMVILRDVTPRKKAEEDLGRSEANFKTIIQQVPDGIFIENRERILFVSQSVVRMLGYDREEELIGHPPLAFVHPDYHPLVLERAVGFYGKAGLHPLLETRWVKKDGSPLAVEVSSTSRSCTRGSRRSWRCFRTSPNEKKPWKPSGNPRKISKPSSRKCRKAC